MHLPEDVLLLLFAPKPPNPVLWVFCPNPPKPAIVADDVSSTCSRRIKVVDNIRRMRKFGGTLKRRLESKDERAAGGGGEV